MIIIIIKTCQPCRLPCKLRRYNIRALGKLCDEELAKVYDEQFIEK